MKTRCFWGYRGAEASQLTLHLQPLEQSITLKRAIPRPDLDAAHRAHGVPLLRPGGCDEDRATRHSRRFAAHVGLCFNVRHFGTAAGQGIRACLIPEVAACATMAASIAVARKTCCEHPSALTFPLTRCEEFPAPLYTPPLCCVSQASRGHVCTHSAVVARNYTAKRSQLLRRHVHGYVDSC